MLAGLCTRIFFCGYVTLFSHYFRGSRAQPATPALREKSETQLLVHINASFPDPQAYTPAALPASWYSITRIDSATKFIT